MAKITINGITYTGNNVSVINNRVFVDGKDVTTGHIAIEESKRITIEITGNVDTLQVDACNEIVVTGSVSTLTTQSGSVDCNDVTGNISTMSGNVDCNNVTGTISTMSGNIKHRKY